MFDSVIFSGALAQVKNHTHEMGKSMQVVLNAEAT